MSYLKARLGLLKSALEYLDKHQRLEKIKQQAQVCKDSSSCLVYSFDVDIDLGEILEQDVNLGMNILSSPLESASLFQEIIFQYCQSHNLLPCETTSTQFCARLKIVSFPSDSCSLQISRLSDLTKYLHYQGFVRLIGVVSGVSAQAKYTQSTKYICPNEGCDGHNGNHYIRMHVPGASETQTIRNDFVCMFCGETLEEVKSLRTLSDKMLVEVIPLHIEGLAQKEMTGNGWVQAIPVFVRDEFVDTVELGKAYEIIGICRTDVAGEDINVKLEANNVIQLQRHLPAHLAILPKHVQEILESSKQSPWSFPLCVAYRFGDMITSGGTMIKLRLLLLISLVLNPQKHFLHILSIGRETALIQSLLQYAQQFAIRHYYTSVTTPFCGKVTTDKHIWAPYFVQCGSVILSSGGVCLLGDVGACKKTNKDQLQTVLSGNKIFLDLAYKHTGGLAQRLAYPLDCHVWAMYDPACPGIKATSQRDDVMGGCDTGDLTKGFLDAFSCVCFIDSGDSITEDEILAQVTSHTLLSWCEEENDTKISEGLSAQEMEQFLTIARQIQVKMTPEAEALIQNYYSASRMARSSGLNGSDVPPSALLTLTSLATGFAMLKLQSSVCESDALMAVFLYEESLAARYGVSVLSIQPEPHIPNSRIKEFLGKQNDLAMQRFHVQLLRFCSRAIDSRSLNKEE